MEKYYKVKKEIAARGGFDEVLRQEVDGEYLMLSEKDIRMISLTIEERLFALGVNEALDEEVEQTDDTEQEVEPVEENTPGEDESSNESDPDDETGEEPEPVEEVEPEITEE